MRKKNYNFGGVWFPEGRWFRNAVLKEKVDFHGATFSAKADFYSTEFHKGIVFRHTTFTQKADFSSALFKAEANFKHAKFNASADFKRATFEGEANFEYAVFRADARFSCEEEKGKSPKGLIKSLNLRYAIIDKPERISFHNLTLSPRWFVDTDPRKFEFTGVTWERVTSERRESNIRKNIDAEIKDLTEVSHPHASLSLASRRLAVNAEDNNRFEEASGFRRMAMEAEWLERKKQIRNWVSRLDIEAVKLRNRFGGSTKKEDQEIPPSTAYGILRRSGDFFIYGLYRLTSFYGESWSRAAGVLLVILVLFALFYTQTNFYVCPPDIPPSQSGQQSLCRTRGLSLYEGTRHSLATATLQNVDYRRPVAGSSETLVLLEKIFAPFQAALLALAIRRKFMR